MILSKPILLVAAFAICSSVVSAAGQCTDHGTADLMLKKHVKSTTGDCHCLPGYGKPEAGTFGEASTICSVKCEPDEFTDGADMCKKVTENAFQYVKKDQSGFFVCADSTAYTPNRCGCPATKPVRTEDTTTGEVTCAVPGEGKHCPTGYKFVAGVAATTTTAATLATCTACTIAPLTFSNQDQTECICEPGTGVVLPVATPAVCKACEPGFFSNEKGECVQPTDTQLMRVDRRGLTADCKTGEYIVGLKCEVCPAPALVEKGKCICRGKPDEAFGLMRACVEGTKLEECGADSHFDATAAKCVACPNNGVRKGFSTEACHAVTATPAGDTKASAGVIGFAPQAALIFGSVLGAVFYYL